MSFVVLWTGDVSFREAYRAICIVKFMPALGCCTKSCPLAASHSWLSSATVEIRGLSGNSVSAGKLSTLAGAVFGPPTAQSTLDGEYSPGV